MSKEQFLDKIFFSKYKPEKKIGEGSFGKIFSAYNIHSNEKFALKMEIKSGGQNLLESEAYVLCYLKGEGIPAVKSYGFSGDHNILVMELLGKSLEDLFQDCSCKFTLKTVCMIADQMITRIEYVHNRHIIHRDIKPDNFIMGVEENCCMVYIIDFGLAKKYRSSRNLQHIKFTNNKKLTGTARYASINALRGTEQSRRDDLEAIGYVLMYFLRGSLPWQGLKVDKREDRYKKIYEKKKSTTAEELCNGFPREFVEYINYTRNLAFEEEPNYDYLRNLFRQVMSNHELQNDLRFDWPITPTNKYNKPLKNDNQYIQNLNDTSNNIDNRNGYVNTNTAVVVTLPDKNKNFFQDNENKNTNSNLYTQTANNEINKPSKFQSNYKFIETLNNTGQLNMNTCVQFTNNDIVQKDNKLQTSLIKSTEDYNGKEFKEVTNSKKNTENKDDSKSSSKKDKNKCLII